MYIITKHARSTSPTFVGRVLEVSIHKLEKITPHGVARDAYAAAPQHLGEFIDAQDAVHIKIRGCAGLCEIFHNRELRYPDRASREA